MALAEGFNGIAHGLIDIGQVFADGAQHGFFGILEVLHEGIQVVIALGHNGGHAAADVLVVVLRDVVLGEAWQVVGFLEQRGFEIEHR